MNVDGLLQLGDGLGKLLLVHIQQTQIGVSILVQRIDLDLLLELLDGLVVLRLLLIGQTQSVVGELVVGIDLDLLLEGLRGLDRPCPARGRRGPDCPRPTCTSDPA